MAHYGGYEWVAEGIHEEDLEDHDEEPADIQPWELFIDDDEEEEDPIEWLWDDEEEEPPIHEEIDCADAPPVEAETDEEEETPLVVMAGVEEVVESPQGALDVPEVEEEVPQEILALPQGEVEPRGELEEGGDTSEEEEWLSELESDEDEAEDEDITRDPELVARMARFEGHEEFHRETFLRRKRAREEGCLGGWLACDYCGEFEHGVDGCTNPPRERVEAPPRREWHRGMKAPRRMTITIGGPGPETSRVFMHARDVQDAIGKLSSMETTPWWRTRGM